MVTINDENVTGQKVRNVNKKKMKTIKENRERIEPCPQGLTRGTFTI